MARWGIHSGNGNSCNFIIVDTRDGELQDQALNVERQILSSLQKLDGSHPYVLRQF